MPTQKQEEAFEKVVNGSNISKAMRDVGYSEETSKRTNKLTNTKGWKKLMETHLPDSELARVHKEGLNATKTVWRKDKKGKEKQVEIADHLTRHKYLDSGYKIKNKYPKEDKNGNDGKPNIIVLPIEIINKHNIDGTASVTEISSE